MIKSVVLLLIIFILNSCGGGSGPENCSIEEQNRYVNSFMQNRYLWYDKLPDLDYTKYSSPEELLADLKYKKDHWSFIIDKDILDKYYSGAGYIGYGFKFVIDNNRALIEHVYDNSPAQKAGMQRGDEILEVNGIELSGKSAEDISKLFGEKKIGVSSTMKLKKVNGDTKEISMKKADITSPSVQKAKIIDNGGLKLGYLLFDRFIEPSNSELDKAFKKFKDNNIDTLIIDLRYNGGGLLDTAKHMASLIRKEESGKLFSKLKFNDMHSSENQSYYFRRESNSLSGINSVYFLTTKSTCSASEAVINGLKPYISNIKIIGSSTCGKPVGMVGGAFCNKYIMPIEFKIVNSNGAGEYYLDSGISPTCKVKDDLMHDLGDTNEAMLNKAIYYINNGSCNSTNERRYRKNVSSNDEKNNLQGVDSIINAF